MKSIYVKFCSPPSDDLVKEIQSRFNAFGYGYGKLKFGGTGLLGCLFVNVDFPPIAPIPDLSDLPCEVHIL